MERLQNKKLKKRLNDFKHRIRMFGCIYQIMKDEELFYIKDKQLKDSSVKADYIKYALIDNKGALPSRQLKLILAWCVLHQDELMQNWELSKDGKPLNRINPLVQEVFVYVSEGSSGSTYERLHSICVF